jgi:AcrR family transcriptional regulator
MGAVRSRSARSSYHHGNLTQALTEAAVGLARTGGPEAVVLREAARTVGVSATAAYRHFAGHSELKDAVRRACQDQLAATMRAATTTGEPLPDPAAEAGRKFHAMARAYFHFARTQPGLYRTAFCVIEKDNQDTALAEIGSAPAYLLLGEVLDELLAAGVMNPQRRPLAETVVWSAAHGLAMLIVEGPLAQFDEQVIEAAIDAVIAAQLAGLLA